ncbi:hypothetical protein CWI38_0113p0020 [Hamiltosporidium tvaerminnensis]|uniref:Uncharacterized protein n=1 Tax=Hamiltosporidium tvaerminnensis TaxID=1176355 RepID=A0A4Q9M0N8_9MICR|nr:hypothetical protein CWI38_0113p0020 [Hamiltosporidium tvaerminnensis]
MGFVEFRQIQDIFEKALSMNEDKEMCIKTKKLLGINVNFMVGILVEKKGQRGCLGWLIKYIKTGMWIESKENTFSKGYINVGSMRGGIIFFGRERFNIRQKVGIKLDLYLRKVYIDD